MKLLSVFVTHVDRDLAKSNSAARPTIGLELFAQTRHGRRGKAAAPM